MENSVKIYKAVLGFPKETLISVDDLASITELSYYVSLSTARALAKENIICLAAICEENKTPAMGVIDGNAENKEYYFCWKFRNKKYEKEYEITFSDSEFSDSDESWHDTVTQLRDICSQKGLSTYKLAELTGLKQQNISRVFGLKYAPTLSVLTKIADAAEVRLRWEGDNPVIE